MPRMIHCRRLDERNRRCRLQRWLLVCLLGLCVGCAPLLPQRTKPGGAARWAAALAVEPAVRWQRDARPCRIVGVGVGSDGWLPDSGGAWILSYWSANTADILEVTVDTDGKVKTQPVADSAFRGHTLPAEWVDSPRVWASTRTHQQGIPINTIEVEFGSGVRADPVTPATWRIRFFLKGGGFETHWVSATGKWLRRE